jgi:putative phage-type endonuclease
MFEEHHLATLSTIIAIYCKQYPEKCVDNELFEYIQTTNDDNEVKKQNIYNILTEILLNDSELCRDLLDLITVELDIARYSPAVQDIVDILQSIIYTISPELSENDNDDDDIELENQNVFIPDDDKEIELMSEIKEVIDHNYSNIVAEEKYKEITEHCIRDHFDHLIDDGIIDDDTFESVLQKAIDDYYSVNPREFGYSPPSILNSNASSIEFKILELQEESQCEQRTPEWYEQRHSLITASSAWKLLDSNANYNSFVKSKCEDFQPRAKPSVDSPLHWGQKYEPVSVELYELLYNTKVGEFGCIRHKKYPFLGASPDGINIDKSSPYYGRMLEIKNIVNREITGIPKKEYWIQMQLQMEVCDLDECDFLECIFKEYSIPSDFFHDDCFYTSDNINVLNKNSQGKFKGAIAMFSSEVNGPYYEYCPLNTTTVEEFDKWSEQVLFKNKDDLFIKYIYWYLDSYSCILVPRNKKWFNDNLDNFRTAWLTIQHEKKYGFEHRFPIKKPSNKTNKKSKTNNDDNSITISISTNLDHLDD